jgi:two-component system, cell cycle sensor histidine kinase and response regulator CckA
MTTEPLATVLIVEDDAGIAELERSRLEEAGYRARVAPTAEAALRALEANDVDLILLDYRLPGDMDGLDFYARVKEAGYDVPVILVTGFSSEATVIQALRVGVRDFVTKSLEYLDYLPDAVGRVLGQVRTEHQLASIIASARDAIISTGPNRRIALFNPAAERMFGCPAAEAVGRPLTDFIPDELAPADSAAGPDAPSLTHRLRTGSRGVRGNGEEFPLETSVARGESGGRRFYTLVVRDVTERKRLEAERDALLARLQLQIERMPLAYLLLDADFRVTDWNAAAERTFGYRRDEVLGMGPPFEKILSPGVWPRCQGIVRRLRAGDMAANAVNDNLTKAGRTITCEWYNTPLMSDEGALRGVLSLAQDVTGRKSLEEQLRQSQKMEAIGRLAGGVAHDFNNLLTIINGYGSLMLDALPAEDPNGELVRGVIAAGERASGLTRQLLAFSRKAIVEPRVLDLKALVTDVERMLRRIVGEDIQLAVAADPGTGAVRADPGQVEQVILNLVVNARDAMPRGGRITIEVRNVELDESYSRTHPDARPGPHVLLAVTDTGCGMDPATLARAFEPFFTTKGDHGTGLGLATVHGIVRQGGGHVGVYSEVGRGTAFKVYLPRVTQAPDASRAALSAMPRGDETVLVVEDEDGVRALIRRVLRGCGYTVLEARDGAEGLQLADAHAGKLDLLVTDVVMPRMGGREVAERVAQRHPGVKVLFLSGYTDDAVVRHGILAAEVAFLQKPFTPGSLAARVREVLDGR